MRSLSPSHNSQCLCQLMSLLSRRRGCELGELRGHEGQHAENGCTFSRYRRNDSAVLEPKLPLAESGTLQQTASCCGGGCLSRTEHLPRQEIRRRDCFAKRYLNATSQPNTRETQMKCRREDWQHDKLQASEACREGQRCRACTLLLGTT